MLSPPVELSPFADVATALDPVRLAQRSGLDPDDWQARVLRSASPRMLLNCSRQSGKSTTTAVLALHRAMYRADSLILVLSPSLRQSAELFRKIAGLYNAVDGVVPASAESSLRLELKNGSRIISLPATEATIRGFSAVSLLLVDEAARVDDDMMAAVRPMLAVSGGRLIAMSTPWGKRGWWWSSWSGGGTAWERYEVPATACPRIASAFLEDERRALPPLVFSAEYCCEFAEPEGSFFRHDDIAAALDPAVTPLFGDADAA